MIQRNLIFLLAVCAILDGIALAQQPAPAGEISAPDTKNQATDDLVIARVSGQPITEKQVILAIDQLASQRQSPLDQHQKRNETFYKEAVDQLITMALLKDQVRQQNVTVDKSEVDQQFQQLSKSFSSQEEFTKAMASRGLTEAELRKNFEETLCVQEVVNRAVQDVPKPTDEEISKFYADNTGKFPVPEQVRASHILLRVDPKSTPEQKEAIKKKLEGIRADIESKKITFAEAAAKYSEDTPNASKGGDMGFFSRGRTVKAFEDAAFSIPPGNLSAIVETQFGYHLIEVTELRPARAATLEEARPAIVQYLTQTSRLKAAQKYLEDLRARATIESFMTQEEFLKRHPDD